MFFHVMFASLIIQDFIFCVRFISTHRKINSSFKCEGKFRAGSMEQMKYI